MNFVCFMIYVFKLQRIMDRSKDILLFKIVFKIYAVDFKPVLAPTNPQIAYFSLETLLPWITVFGGQFYHRVYF